MEKDKAPGFGVNELSSNIRIPLVDLVAQYQSIREDLDAAIRDVVEKGQFIGGEEVGRFAKQFARFCQVPYCVPCANGTDALEIALSALGIGPGDEVIIPALTFVATLEAVCNVGATPVLCDIDPHRLTMDPRLAISLVTPQTKAFVPVHLYGQMADMEMLTAFAAGQNLFLIEDAAQAHGATYKGQKAGSLGDINTFSFYPGKNLGAYGDAGAITTDREALFTKAAMLANHGRVTKYEHDIIGRNSRMDTLQAAILSVKLRHLEAWTERRRILAKRYDDLLGDIGSIRIQETYPDSPNVYHLYVVRVNPLIRHDFRAHLLARGIETGIHYPVALSRLQVTTGQLNIHVHCPEAEKVSEEVVSLPLYPEMTSDMQEYICDQVKGFFAG